MEQVLSLQDSDGVDEAWVSEWLRFGFAEMAGYLRRHAAFEDYYQQRQLRQASLPNR